MEIVPDDAMRRLICRRVIWQAICGVVIEAVRNENGSGGSSPGWTFEDRPVDAAAVQARRRTGLEATDGKPAPAKASLKPKAAGSPTRPPGVLDVPTRISPRRKVPVVSTTAPADNVRPSWSDTRDPALANDQPGHRPLDNAQAGVD